QRGDPRVVEDPRGLPAAPEVVPIRAEEGGFVAAIDPLELGLSAVALGAGRTRADPAVDAAVGIEIAAPRGARVARGDELARVHARRAADAEAVSARIQAAFRLGAEPPPTAPLVLERIDGAAAPAGRVSSGAPPH
ncbi:MAG: hypothetical protein IT372_39020, partial [Polyangiaceae bacterium]|nr:hypothetical protein [Polyangiaceae bacterium]